MSEPQQTNSCTLLAGIFASYVYEHGLDAIVGHDDDDITRRLDQDLRYAQGQFERSENLNGYTPAEAAAAFLDKHYDSNISFKNSRQLDCQRDQSAMDYAALVDDVIHELSRQDDLDEQSKALIQEGLMDRVMATEMPNECQNLLTEKCFAWQALTEAEIQRLQAHEGSDDHGRLATVLDEHIQGATLLITQNGHTIVAGQDNHQPLYYYIYDSATGTVQYSKHSNVIIERLSTKINSTPGAPDVTQLSFTRRDQLNQPQHSYINTKTVLGTGIMVASIGAWLICPQAYYSEVALRLIVVELTYAALMAISFGVGAAISLYGLFAQPVAHHDDEPAILPSANAKSVI